MSQPQNAAIIRAHIYLNRTQYAAARKRMVEIGFTPSRGFSGYIQQLIRADLRSGKEGK